MLDRSIGVRLEAIERLGVSGRMTRAGIPSRLAPPIVRRRRDRSRRPRQLPHRLVVSGTAHDARHREERSDAGSRRLGEPQVPRRQGSQRIGPDVNPVRRRLRKAVVIDRVGHPWRPSSYPTVSASSRSERGWAETERTRPRAPESIPRRSERSDSLASMTRSETETPTSAAEQRIVELESLVRDRDRLAALLADAEQRTARIPELEQRIADLQEEVAAQRRTAEIARLKTQQLEPNADVWSPGAPLCPPGDQATA